MIQKRHITISQHIETRIKVGVIMIVHVFCSHYLHDIIFTKTIRTDVCSHLWKNCEHQLTPEGPVQMFVSSLSYRFKWGHV